MATNIPGLTTSYKAGGALTKRRWVTYGADDKSAVQATAATNPLIGVTTDVDSAIGTHVDAFRFGPVPIEYGGNVARGDRLTTDAQGRAVVATAGNQFGGYAEVAGVLGDIGAVFLARGVA